MIRVLLSLLTWRGPVRAFACPTCGAVVLTRYGDRHELWHTSRLDGVR